MLTYDDALNMNYYKKTSFTGWMNGMRFLIKREMKTITEPDPSGAAGEDGSPLTITKEIPQFHAWVWPGPYIFDLTPDEKKTGFTAPFTDEGRRQVVDWINEQYTTRSKEWPERKIILE